MIIKTYLNKINISSYTIILIFLAFLAGLFKEIIVISIIILIHEFGHYIYFIRYNWNVKKIVIYPFGGICILDDRIDKPLEEEFVITIMGIIFQELLFIIIIILFKLGIVDLYIFNLFKNYNFTILLFNLLPIIPLDGSKLLNIITNKFINFRLSYLINIFISILVLFIFFYIFKYDSSYYLIFLFLSFQIFYFYKNRRIIFSRFILEKSLYKNHYIKYKKIDNLKKMYRNKRHLIKKNKNYITESKYIKKYSRYN